MTDDSPGEARLPLPGGDTYFPVIELLALARRGIGGLYLRFRAGLSVVQDEQTAALAVDAVLARGDLPGQEPAWRSLGLSLIHI